MSDGDSCAKDLNYVEAVEDVWDLCFGLVRLKSGPCVWVVGVCCFFVAMSVYISACW